MNIVKVKVMMIDGERQLRRKRESKDEPKLQLKVTRKTVVRVKMKMQ